MKLSMVAAVVLCASLCGCGTRAPAPPGPNAARAWSEAQAGAPSGQQGRVRESFIANAWPSPSGDRAVVMVARNMGREPVIRGGVPEVQLRRSMVGGVQAIWLVDLAGRRLEQLPVQPSRQRDIAWSPDERAIAYVADGPSIARYDIATGRRATVARLEQYHYVGSPLWSPNGRRIAFEAAPRGEAPAVLSAPADGSLPPRVEVAPAQAWCWAGAGERVVYVPGWDAPPPSGKPLAKRLDLSGVVSAAALRPSPDGAKLACVLWDGEEGRVCVFASRSRRLAESAPLSSPPYWLAWSPNSQEVAFGESHGYRGRDLMPAMTSVLGLTAQPEKPIDDPSLQGLQFVGWLKWKDVVRPAFTDGDRLLVRAEEGDSVRSLPRLQEDGSLTFDAH